MLIAVRHGKTSANEDGVERLRGWSNIPLNTEGKHGAHHVANVIKNLKIPFHSFHTSPLRRAVQTAEHIGSEIDMAPNMTDNLKDWNVGDLTGQHVESTLPLIHKYMENPGKAIPGGESYNSFANRVGPFLKQLIEDKDNTHLIVSHNRVMTLLNALSKSRGGPPDIRELKKKGPVEPSGVMSLDPDYDMNIIDKGNVGSKHHKISGV